MRIGVDIDGVVADTFPLLLRELNSYFGRQIQAADFTHYDIRKVYGISEQEFREFIRSKELYLMEDSLPMAGVVHYLNLLAARHKIFLITARREEFRDPTKKWLSSHGICYEELFLLGSPAKGETCGALGLHAFVEDNPYNARQLTGCGIPILLLDRPYNQGPMPVAVIRVGSWADIYHQIRQLA